MKIGAYLKRAREAKRLSQQEVADLLSVSQKTLSNFESDKSQPTFYQLALMDELYELNVIEILSKHGITFRLSSNENESHSKADHRYYVEIRKLFEQLLEEKDSRIALLEELIDRLKNESA